MSGPPLLEARDLSVRHLRHTGCLSRSASTDVLRGVNLQLAAGEKLAVVGESGSGNTVASLTLLRLAPPSARIVAATFSAIERTVASLTSAAVTASRESVSGSACGM